MRAQRESAAAAIGVVALMCLAGRALAGVPPASAPPEPVAASGPASSSAVGRARLGGTAALDYAWFSAADRARHGAFSGAAERLKAVAAERKHLGIPNFYRMAEVTLTWAVQAAAKDDDGGAHALLSVAKTLAPESPRVPLVAAEVTWNLDGFGPAIGGMLSDALTLQYDNLSARLALIARLSLAGLLLTYTLCILFGLAMLRRYGPLLAHDAGLLLPSALRGGPFRALGVVGLVALPLALGVGLALLSLGWMVILWPYPSRRERMVGAALALCVALTPIANRRIKAALEGRSGPELPTFECTHGRCPPGRLDAFLRATRGQETPRPDDAVIVALAQKRLGIAQRRTTPLSVAVVGLTQFHRRAPPTYRSLVTLANTMLARGNMECAQGGAAPPLKELLAFYRQASGMRPHPFEAELGRAVVLAQLGQKNEAEAAFSQAAALEPDSLFLAAARSPSALPPALEGRAAPQTSELSAGVSDHPAPSPASISASSDGSHFVCPALFDASRVLPDPLPSTDELYRAVLSRVSGRGAVSVPLPLLLVGIVDAGFLSVMGLLCALLLLLGGLLSRVVRPAYRCKTCGAIASERERRELSKLAICGRCLFIDVQGAFVDSQARWRRDREIAARADRGRRGSLVATLFLPGLGQLIAGRTLSGIAFLGVFLGGLSVMLSPWGVPDPGIVGFSGLPLAVLGGFVAVSSWLLAAIVIWRERSR